MALVELRGKLGSRQALELQEGVSAALRQEAFAAAASVKCAFIYDLRLQMRILHYDIWMRHLPCVIMVVQHDCVPTRTKATMSPGASHI